MSNLDLYDQFRAVPNEAKKIITGGRLNGKTDINPMWRIKTLTDAFGPCGIGWWYEITDKRLETSSLGEVSAFVDIALYYIKDGQVSKPVYGTGGSAFIAKEKNGLYQSDECYKMALTDAISVACKALGVGADVYWDKDNTKYTRQEAPLPKCEICGKDITGNTANTPQAYADGTRTRTGKARCAACFKAWRAEHPDEKAAG
jgi:hypothetical protein